MKYVWSCWDEIPLEVKVFAIFTRKGSFVLKFKNWDCAQVFSSTRQIY